MDPSTADRARLVDRFRRQADSAGALGSALYAALLATAAEDVAAGGACWSLLRGHAHEGEGSALPLRFMAAVHRLVLRRMAPGLALHYASVGGTAGLDGAPSAFLAAVESHVDDLVDLVDLPCQTNEVGRSAATAPAMAWLAARHGMPVHQREIGASAGLNLRWDRFRYGTADGSVTWGPADSPVDLTGHWEVPPALDPRAPQPTPSAGAAEDLVASRMGCDPAPLDPGSAADRETLTASVWADQVDRLARLKGALALAAEVPATVHRSGAGDWLPDVLDARPPGLTVVTHSVVWRYIPPVEQQAVLDVLHRVGAAATAATPLAWLRLEPRPPAMTYDGNPYPILATTWPGGETVELGTAQAHGQQVRWVADEPIARIERP